MDKKIFITPAAAAGAIGLFFVPWIKVTLRVFIPLVDYQSGAVLGGICWTVLAAAITIILACGVGIYLQQLHQAKWAVYVSSLLAFGALIKRYLDRPKIDQDWGLQSDNINFQITLEWGLYALIGCFLVSMVGTWFWKRPATTQAKE